MPACALEALRFACAHFAGKAGNLACSFGTRRACYWKQLVCRYRAPYDRSCCSHAWESPTAAWGIGFEQHVQVSLAAQPFVSPFPGCFRLR